MQTLDSFNPTKVVATQPIISICHLNHYFGQGQLRKQVLFDINLEIYPGEIVIMTGPSGSGKTTLLMLISGLRSCQEGSLRVAGQELSGAKRNELMQVRRKIGYIFQAHNLLRSLTALQNVQIASEPHPTSPFRRDKQELLKHWRQSG